MTPTIERATAEAIIARAADGLAPFLALCRKMLATERAEVFAEATRAVNAGEAVQNVIIEVTQDGLRISLVLIDPKSTLPAPLFCLMCPSQNLI